MFNHSVLRKKFNHGIGKLNALCVQVREYTVDLSDFPALTPTTEQRYLFWIVLMYMQRYIRSHRHFENISENNWFL